MQCTALIHTCVLVIKSPDLELSLLSRSASAQRLLFALPPLQISGSRVTILGGRLVRYSQPLDLSVSYWTRRMTTLLDLLVSSLRRGHANLLCIVSSLTDDPRRASMKHGALYVATEKLITSMSAVNITAFHHCRFTIDEALHLDTPLIIRVRKSCIQAKRKCRRIVTTSLWQVRARHHLHEERIVNRSVAKSGVPTTRVQDQVCNVCWSGGIAISLARFCDMTTMCLESCCGKVWHRPAAHYVADPTVTAVSIRRHEARGHRTWREITSGIC